MGLQDLQPELIIQICENLCHHCLGKHIDPPMRELWFQDPDPKTYRHALLDLSLTCRKVGSIAQAVLHHHCGFLERSDPAIFHFCRTISGSPRLGKEVRFLSFKRMQNLPRIEAAREWLPDVVEKFRPLLALPDQPANVPDTFDNRYMSLMTVIPSLIVLQTPLLQHVGVAGYLSWSLFNMFSRRAVLQSGQLPQHLKGLVLGQFSQGFDAPSPFADLDLSQDETGCYLSALKKLDTLHLHNPLGSSITADLSLGNVRVLRICEALLTKEQLRTLLQLTKRLKEFAFTERLVVLPDTPEMISSQEMFEVLATKNDTLERAVLFVDFQVERPVAASSLTNLQQLRISANALYETFLPPGQDLTELEKTALVGVFPPSIRTLHVDANAKDLYRIKHAFAHYILSTCGSETAEQKLKRVVVNLLVRMDPDERNSAGRTPDQAIRWYKTFFMLKCQRWLRGGTFEFFKGSKIWHQIGLGEAVAVCRAFSREPDISKLTLQD